MPLPRADICGVPDGVATLVRTIHTVALATFAGRDAMTVEGLRMVLRLVEARELC